VPTLVHLALHLGGIRRQWKLLRAQAVGATLKP